MILDELRPWRVVPDRLRHWVETRPDQEFVRCGSDWLTFADLDRRAAAVAGALATRGIGKGDRVAVVMPNRLETVLTVFALAKLGAVHVPINVFLKGEFLRYQLHDSGAVALIADEAGFDQADRVRDGLPDLHTVVVAGSGPSAPPGAVPFAELVSSAIEAPEVDLAPSDLVAILYTSGTTGLPKGCMLSHGYYMSSTWGWYENDWYRPEDRLITAMPLFHIGALALSLMGALLGGLPVSIETSFSATAFLDQVRDARATVAFGVGPMAMALLARPPEPTDRDHDLRVAAFMPMPPDSQETFEKRFGVTVATEVFGQTEGTPITMSPLGAHKRTPGCVGPAVSQFEVKVVDDHDHDVAVGEVGELLVRPSEPAVMFSGYWNKPEATVETFRNLWHHTGDAVRADADGYLTFVDRKKDSMRRRGENISSRELEAAITVHPKIAAVATHGVPSPLGDDDVKAWLVLEPGVSVTPDELMEFFGANLPYFAIPRYVQIVDALPTNALGRVQKFELRAAGHDGAWDFEALGLVVDKSQRR